MTSLGTTSCNNASRLPPISPWKKLTPVALPWGRLRLATNPTLIGSLPFANTIGMLLVALITACAELALPVAAMTATWRETRSAASVGSAS
jgi:hypothetical protein